MKYPLMRNNILREDLDAVIEHLKQEDPILTHGSNVRAFEAEWSAWLGVKHSVFVNSGASANLLTMAVLKIRYPEGGRGHCSALGLGVRYRVGVAEWIHTGLCRYRSSDVGDGFRQDSCGDHGTDARSIPHPRSRLRWAGGSVVERIAAAAYSTDRGRV